MMSRSSVFGVAVALVVIFFGNVFFGLFSTVAQSSDGRSLRWDRFDVTINNVDTSNNRFDVTESYALTIETGPYSFGTADIPLGRIEAIEGVSVYDGNTALQASCLGQAGTYCAQSDGSNYSIKYYFRSQARSGEQRSIRLVYRVRGALRSYSGGDQLYWVAVPGDRPFPVLASTVTVVMPSDRLPEKTATYPDTWQESINGGTITWQSPGRLDPGDSVEVRVQYPHDAQMSAPSWQSRYDLERSYVDNWQPLVSLLLVALTVFIVIGGVIAVVIRYLRFGRDPKALVVPEYLTEPPTEERPGMVGLLVDEKADMRDILATLIDLARREYIVIEQTKSPSLMGLLGGADFTFHRTEKPLSGLRPYETALINGMFPGGRSSTKLDQLKTKFYQHIPTIKRLMYDELVTGEYFKRSPETTRMIWIFGGLAVAIGGSVLFWLSRSLTLISPVIGVPPIGLAIIGGMAALFGEYMPAKTLKGSQDAARWRAFRRYLERIEHYAGVEDAAKQFDLFLGYAVAFGSDKDLVRQLTPALTAMPIWYQPTYLGGPWGRPYHRGGSPLSSGGSGMGDFSLGGPGGLNDMSRSLTDGLNAMNNGLTSMLNDASRAMTTRPKSSGSGGGFSGGGGHGGGSGGGSRGFG